MDEMKRDVVEIKVCIARIEEDIRHHIERTNALQKMTEPMWKIFTTLKYGAMLLIGLSAVVGAIAKLKGYL